jgi:hypothetical protein
VRLGGSADRAVRGRAGAGLWWCKPQADGGGARIVAVATGKFSALGDADRNDSGGARSCGRARNSPLRASQITTQAGRPLRTFAAASQRA